jgi:hypothetical protein
MSALLLGAAIATLTIAAYFGAFLAGAAAKSGDLDRKTGRWLCLQSFGCMWLAILLVAWFA